MAYKLLVAAHGISVLHPGIRPIQPAVECRVLTTGPQGSPMLAKCAGAPAVRRPWGGGKGSAFSHLPPGVKPGLSGPWARSALLQLSTSRALFLCSWDTHRSYVEKSSFPGLRAPGAPWAWPACRWGPSCRHLCLGDFPPSRALPHPPSSSQKTLVTPRHLI